VLILAVLAVWMGFAQQPPPPPIPTVEPPEEDPSAIPKEYVLNPLQAEKELKIGNFYFKRKSYKAAAARFDEATKWNPGYAEAFLRLGEAKEKLKDEKAARAAYEKYLELAPEAKNAAAIKKKIAALIAGQTDPKS